MQIDLLSNSPVKDSVNLIFLSFMCVYSISQQKFVLTLNLLNFSTNKQLTNQKQPQATNMLLTAKKESKTTTKV